MSKDWFLERNLATSNTSIKPTLRRQFRARRADFVKQGGGQKASVLLSSNLKRLIKDLDVAQVAIYSPMADEAAFHLEGKFFYPRLTGDEMTFLRPLTDHNFSPGALGIAEPEPEFSEAIDLNVPILICCPAVAMDWDGGRLGMGKGYYDRFFNRFPSALRVGVAFQVQVTKDPLPLDSWDQPLDWVVTEEMILRTSKRSLE